MSGLLAISLIASSASIAVVSCAGTSNLDKIAKEKEIQQH